MASFGRIRQGVGIKQPHRYAIQSFVFKEQLYWTTATLAQCLPTWTSSSAVENTYSLNHSLIELLQVLEKEEQITKDNIQTLTRTYQCLELRLEQEQARIKKQSRWFSSTQQTYLLVWKKEIQAARTRVAAKLTQLQIKAQIFSREKPVPLEIMLFNTKSLGKPFMLKMPLELIPYSPIQGSLWAWWFNLQGYYAYLSAKQDLLSSLQLQLESPEADYQQIAAIEAKLRAELNATIQALEEASFYEVYWCRFLEMWKKALKAALVRLAEGKAVWHQRINARLEQQVVAIKEDTETKLSSLDPDAFEYWTDEDITNAQDQLKQLESDLCAQVQALDKETGGIDIQNKVGKALYNQITAVQTKIKQRQQTFQDMSLLSQKKAQLGELPPYSMEIPAINVEDLDSDPFIIKIRAWEATVKAAKEELATPSRGLQQQQYLQKWENYLASYYQDIVALKIKLLGNIYNVLTTQQSLTIQSAKKIQDFLDESLEVGIKIGWLADEKKNLQLICDAIKSILKRKCEDNLGHILLEPVNIGEIDSGIEIVNGLSSGDQYCSLETIRWLNRLFERIRFQQIHLLSDGNNYSDKLEKLNALLLTVLPVAEKICNQRFGSLEKDGNKLCIDKDYLEEILCFGSLLRLGNEQVKLRQQAGLKSYLLQQLKYFTVSRTITAEDTEDLQTFETIMLELCPEYTAKLQALQSRREKEAWLSYKTCCQEWLALLTQSPVATLNGLGLLSSPAQLPTASNSQESTANIP